MQIDAQTAVAVIAPCVAAVVWLVRLEGRINLADQRYKDIKESLERIGEKIDAMDDIKYDLALIRKYLHNQ